MIRTKISAFAAAAVLIGVSAVPVFAANSYSQNYALIDEANLFDAAGSEQLCATLEKTGRETGWQVAVVTTTYNISASEMDSYYNNYYDNHREWFTTDSAMLIIDAGSNNRYILTHGVAEAYFTDERMTQIKNEMKPYLNDNDMLGAAKTFAAMNAEFYRGGIPENGGHSNHVDGVDPKKAAEEQEKKNNKLGYVLSHYGWIFGLVALAAGGIFAGVNVGRYKYNGKGGTYNLKENSRINLVDQQDVFLNKHTTYTTINTSSGSSGGSSGGSSSHGGSGAF